MKNRLILYLLVLSMSSLWNIAFAFGNLVTRSVLNQTINFIAMASVYISLSMILKDYLSLINKTKQSYYQNLRYILYAFTSYFIGHSGLYLINCFRFYNDYKGWEDKFYDNSIFVIPLIMIIVLSFQVLIDFRWKKKESAKRYLIGS